MFKFLSVLAVVVLTACGPTSKDADSTEVKVDSATVVADSVAFDSTLAAKTDSVAK